MKKHIDVLNILKELNPTIGFMSKGTPELRRIIIEPNGVVKFSYNGNDNEFYNVKVEGTVNIDLLRDSVDSVKSYSIQLLKILNLPDDFQETRFVAYLKFKGCDDILILENDSYNIVEVLYILARSIKEDE